MELTLRRLTGSEIREEATRVAELRILVFREFPYLYAGNMKYEHGYLESYSKCARARVILAFDADECVGASTVMPLSDCEEEVVAPFRSAGYDLSRIDYFGESVVKKEYRGRGLGVRFFEEREAHAREFSLSLCAFCAVERDPADRRRPADYVGNDAFWRKRGYEKHPELVSKFSWPDLGETASSEKSMAFYLKELAS